MRLSVALFLVSALAASAHPGEHHEEESNNLVLARREHHAAAARGLRACQNRQSYRELQARAIERRAAAVNTHRKVKRVDASGTGHNLTDSRTDITADSDEGTVFGDTHSCILNPEGETGPFYVPGELIRSNVRETQPGVPVVIDGQFINVETCEPIQGLFWDLWNCNSTGVYSGLVATGNGNAADASNLNKTFLRGIQETDSDGVVQFLTVFPGHYSGRTTHHHMVAWINATILPNNTIVSGQAAHIGQLFWDQDLIYDVEATSPYNTNTIAITENADDRVVQAEVTNSDSDPFFDYVYLGDSLEDGLFGWITIGINTSASYEPNYSFEYTDDGGVALGDTVGSDNVDGGSPMSGGFPGGNSTIGAFSGTGLPSGVSAGSTGTGLGTSANSTGTAASTGASSTVSTVAVVSRACSTNTSALSIFIPVVSALIGLSGLLTGLVWMRN